MPAHRAIALALAVTFAAVGALFFLAPGSIAALFDEAARQLEARALPPGAIEAGLFRVLAAAYMYLVAWLAWMTFKRPDEEVWPAVLAQAKLASAILSLLLVLAVGSSVVLLTNAVVDGFLGGLALWLRRQAVARRLAARVAAP